MPRSYLTELNRINRRRRTETTAERRNLMAPQSFAAIKKQNHLESLLTP